MSLFPQNPILFFIFFISATLSSTPSSPYPLWCVAKNNAEDGSLQTAIDWACGPGGSDCGPIQQGGACYDPNDLLKMASFAFNTYFLKNGLAPDSCDFSGNAALTSLDPSHGSCKFPSSLSVNNASYKDSPANTGFGTSSAYISSATPVPTSLFWSSITITNLLFTILVSSEACYDSVSC